MSYRIYGDRPALRHERGFVHVYSLKFAVPLTDDDFLELAQAWVAAGETGHLWTEACELHPHHGWAFAPDLGVIAVEPDWGTPLATFYETRDQFFDRVHARIGLIDVVHHSARGDQRRRSDKDRAALAAGPPAAAVGPTSVCPAYARPPGEGPRPSYRPDFLNAVIDARDRPIISKLRPPRPDGVGLLRAPSLPETVPAWRGDVPFAQHDLQLSTPFPAAWRRAVGIVYPQGYPDDNEVVEANNDEPFASYEFVIGGERQVGSVIEFSTTAAGWAFDTKTGRCTCFIGRDDGNDEVLGAFRIEGGAVLLSRRSGSSQSRLRLFRMRGVEPACIATATTRADRLALGCDDRVAIVHGMGGAELFAIGAASLRSLHVLRCEATEFRGETGEPGDKQLRFDGYAGRSGFAWTGVEAVLDALPPGPAPTAPEGLHTWALEDLIPAASDLEGVYRSRRAGAWSYGVRSEDRKALVVKRDGEPESVVQLAEDERFLTLDERGRAYVVDRSDQRLTVRRNDGAAPVVVLEAKAGKRLTSAHVRDGVGYLWEERPNVIHRVAEVDGQWKRTHGCKPGAKASYCVGNARALVVMPLNGVRMLPTVYRIPRSARKKTLEVVAPLEESYDRVASWDGELYMRRSWHDGRVWQVRGHASAED